MAVYDYLTGIAQGRAEPADIGDRPNTPWSPNAPLDPGAVQSTTSDQQEQ